MGWSSGFHAIDDLPCAHWDEREFSLYSSLDRFKSYLVTHHKRQGCCDEAQLSHPMTKPTNWHVRLKKTWVLSYLLSTQRTLWSDWVDWAGRTVIFLVLSWGGWIYPVLSFCPDVYGHYLWFCYSGLLRFYQLLALAYFVLGCICIPRLVEPLSSGGPMQLVIQLLSVSTCLQAVGAFIMMMHLRK